MQHADLLLGFLVAAVFMHKSHLDQCRTCKPSPPLSLAAARPVERHMSTRSLLTPASTTSSSSSTISSSSQLSSLHSSAQHSRSVTTLLQPCRWTLLAAVQRQGWLQVPGVVVAYLDLLPCLHNQHVSTPSPGMCQQGLHHAGGQGRSCHNEAQGR